MIFALFFSRQKKLRLLWLLSGLLIGFLIVSLVLRNDAEPSHISSNSPHLEESVSAIESEPFSAAVVADSDPQQDPAKSAVQFTLGEALGLVPNTGDQSWVADFAKIATEETTSLTPASPNVGPVTLEPDAPQVTQAVHSFRPVPGIDSKSAGSYRAFYAWHPRQDLQVSIDPIGFSLAVDGKRWLLNATGLNVNGTHEPLPAVAERVDVQADIGFLQKGRLKQYFSNEAERPEQWMEVQGEGRVTGLVELNYQYTGDFALRVGDEGRAVYLTAANGLEMKYHGLRAWDADGVELAASFELDARRLTVALNTKNARYPLIIDPLIERVKTAELSDLALTVASDSDIVAVGAPDFDYDTGTFDRYQAIMQAVEREYLKTTLGVVQSMIPAPDLIDMGIAFATGVVSGIFSGTDYVDQAEEIAVLENIGMVWVFARGVNKWVLAATLDNVVESQTQARKSLDTRGVSYDNWRLGEGLAVAGGQLLVGEPGRAYWELAEIPDIVTGIGQLVPGVGSALTWADGRPLHTKPRRKGAVYVFNNPQYEGPVQIIDGIFDGVQMFGEVGAKIVVEGERAVFFSGTSIKARSGSLVERDDTETPSPSNSTWVAHFFERDGSFWSAKQRFRTYPSFDPVASPLDAEAYFAEVIAYNEGMPILAGAALDSHGDLWVGHTVKADTEVQVVQIDPVADRYYNIASAPAGGFSIDHWGGGSRTDRSHIVLGLPTAASGAGQVRLIDTTTKTAGTAPLTCQVTGAADQGLGRSVVALDVALLASDDAGKVQGYRDDTGGWRAMTEEESGPLGNLANVQQLAAGQFWSVALTAAEDTSRGIEIFSAEIPRTISGRLTYNGEPVVGMPIDAMEFIVLKGEGVEIEPFAYECGVNCDQRSPDEPLLFNPDAGRYIELANFSLKGYWGPARTGRMIPIMGYEIEGAPELRSLSFLAGGYNPTDPKGREWGLYGRVRPLIAATEGGGFRGAYYGEVTEDFFESFGDLRDPTSASGWDELRKGILRPNPPMIPNQDRIRLLMYDPYDGVGGRSTSSVGVGAGFEARLAMGKQRSTRVLTDEEGRFTITGLRASTAGLRLSRGPEDGSDPVPAGVFKLSQGGEDIDLYGQVAVSGVELEMNGGGYGFSGRVAGAGAQVTQTFQFTTEESPKNNAQALSVKQAPGIGGIEVKATLQDSFNFSAETVTDTAGSYSFSDLPPGDYLVELGALNDGWQTVSAQRVSAGYKGSSGSYEYAYRQRGVPGGNAATIANQGASTNLENLYEAAGLRIGEGDAAVRASIAEALPWKSGGVLIAWEYGIVNGETFRNPYKGYAELKRLRNYFAGADFKLNGARSLTVSAPQDGTRIRWSNTLGQTGVVELVDGSLTLNGLAPSIYTFELLGGTEGFAASELTVDTRTATAKRADFLYTNAGSLVFSGADARTLAGLSPSDPLNFSNTVRLISTVGSRSATTDTVRTLTPESISGADIWSLSINGLDVGGERTVRETSFKGTGLTGSWQAIYTGSSQTDHGGQIAATAKVDNITPGAQDASLRLRVMTYGIRNSAANKFVLIDPLGQRTPFEFDYTTTDEREVLIEDLDVPAIAGTWQIEVESIAHAVNLYSATLSFDDALTQRSAVGRATVTVSDSSNTASLLEWVDPYGRTHPFVVPAGDSAAAREVSVAGLEPVNGEWTLRGLEVRGDLTLSAGRIEFPHSASQFSVKLDAAGAGRASSLPTGDYWVNLAPRLTGAQPVVFVGPQKVTVVAGESRSMALRGEPLARVSVQAVDQVGASISQADLNGQIVGYSDSVPGYSWRLEPIAGQSIYRGLLPWWAKNASTMGDAQLFFAGLDTQWSQFTLDGAPTDRGSQLNQTISIVEDSIQGFVLDRGQAVEGASVLLDTSERQTTDANGFFNFQSSPPGERTVSVDLVGYSSANVVHRGATTVVELEREVETLSGRVVRRGDVPVPGVLVSLTGNGESASQTTNAAGEYSFQVPAGSYTINYSKRFYEARDALSAQKIAGGTALDDFYLPRDLQTVSGRILRDGAGLVNATVQLKGTTYWRSRDEFEPVIVRTTQTDNEGRYTFVDVPHGFYDLQPIEDGFFFTPSDRRYRTYVVSSDTPEYSESLIQTDFTASGSSISGQVNLAGSGLTGVRIHVQDSSGTLVASSISAPDGSFKLPVLAAGSYTVKAVSGNENFNTQFSAGTRTLEVTGTGDIVLESFDVAEAVFSATVVDELDDPVVGATVEISGIKELVLTTDTNGAVSTSLPSGDYWIRTRASGVDFNDFNSETGLGNLTQLRSSTNTRRFEGFRGAEVTGQVMLDGQPAAGVEVRIGEGYPTPAAAVATTDATGAYYFSKLPRASYLVYPEKALQQRNHLSTSTSTLVADVREARSLVAIPDIVFQRYGTVSGRVTWQGAPMENVSVRLAGQRSFYGFGPAREFMNFSVSSAADGRFTLLDVPAGGGYSLTTSPASSITGSTFDGSVSASGESGIALEIYAVSPIKFNLREDSSAGHFPVRPDRFLINGVAITLGAEEDPLDFIRSIPFGVPLSYEISAPGYHTLSATRSAWGAGLSFSLQPDFSIAGRVNDFDGQALVGAQVNFDVTRGGRTYSRFKQATVDKNGNFFLRQIYPNSSYTAYLDEWQTISGRDFYFPDHLNRRSFEAGSTDWFISDPLVGSYVPDSEMAPFEAYVEGSEALGAIRLRLPAEWVAADESYAVAFWMRSSVDWFAQPGTRIGLLGSTSESVVWELTDGQFSGDSGEGVTPQGAVPGGDWQLMSLQFAPVADGQRSVAVYRFGVLVDQVTLPAGETRTDTEVDLVVALGAGDRLAGLQFERGVVGADQRYSLNRGLLQPLAGAALEFTTLADIGYKATSSGDARWFTLPDFATLPSGSAPKSVTTTTVQEGTNIAYVKYLKLGFDDGDQAGTSGYAVSSLGIGVHDFEFEQRVLRAEVVALVKSMELNTQADWFSGTTRDLVISFNYPVPGEGLMLELDYGGMPSLKAEGAATSYSFFVAGGATSKTLSLTTSRANTLEQGALTLSNADAYEYERLNLQLLPSLFDVSGQFINTATGEGIAGLTVSLGSRTGTSDLDGRFRFADVLRGTHSVSHRNAGWSFVGNNNRQVTITDRAIEIPVIEATGQFLMSGQVSEAGYGGLAEVDVVLRGPGIVDGIKVKTNSAGNYQFSGLGAGNYTLTVTDKRIFPTEQSTNFDLEDWGETHNLEIKQGPLSFSLIGKNAAPWRGDRAVVVGRTYTVNASGLSFDSSTNTWNPSFKTQEEVNPAATSLTTRLAIAQSPAERFRLEALVANLPVGWTDYAYAINSYGFTPSDALPYASFWGDGRPVDFSLIPDLDIPETAQVLSIRGDTGYTFQDATARSYVGAVEEKVNVIARLNMTSVPDDDLIFYLSSSHPEILTVPPSLTVAGISSGGASTRLEVPLYTRPVSEPTIVTVTLRYGLDRFAGQMTSEITLVPAQTISGRITDVTGAGVAGIAVTDNIYHWQTDNDGYYTVELTDPSQARQVAPVLASSSLQSSPSQLDFGANLLKSFTGQDFVLSGDLSMSGQVTGLNDSTLETVTIHVGNGTTTTDSAGAYALESLLPGEYLVRPELAGYQFEPSQVTVNLPEDASMAFDFAATGTDNLAGTITTGGQALIGAAVEVRNRSGSLIASGKTRSGGVFTFPGLSTGGNLQVTVRASGYATRTVDLDSQSIGDWTLALAPNQVSGTILRADGKPLANARITVGALEAMTDSFGAYTLFGVPEGELDLLLTADGWSGTTTVTVPVGGGTFTGKDLTLLSGVSGRVTDTAGEGLADITVALIGTEAPKLPTLTFPMDLSFDPDGDVDYEEKFFQVTRTGNVNALSLGLVLSGNGADWAALRIVPPSGIRDLFDLVKGDNATKLEYDGVGPNRRVRLNFDSASDSSTNAAFKAWFDSTLKGKDVSGFWKIEIYMARSRNPFTGQYASYRDYAAYTLESLSINPETPTTPSSETTTTDAQGYYAFAAGPSVYTITASGANSTQGFAPASRMIDTRVGPEHVDFVQSLHPAVLWSVPSTYMKGVDSFAQLQGATASVAGSFSYMPATEAGLALGEVDLQLVFTPDDDQYPTRNLTRRLTVSRLPTPLESQLAALGDALPEGQRGPMDDPDGDGMPNLLEVFLGGKAESASGAGALLQMVATPPAEEGGAPDLPILMLALPAGIEFSADSQPSVVWSGYRITVQGSLDLGAFDTAVREVSPPSGHTAPIGYRLRAFEVNASDAPSGFLRLSVEPSGEDTP